VLIRPTAPAAFSLLLARAALFMETSSASAMRIAWRRFACACCSRSSPLVVIFGSCGVVGGSGGEHPYRWLARRNKSWCRVAENDTPDDRRMLKRVLFPKDGTRQTYLPQDGVRRAKFPQDGARQTLPPQDGRVPSLTLLDVSVKSTVTSRSITQSQASKWYGAAAPSGWNVADGEVRIYEAPGTGALPNVSQKTVVRIAIKRSDINLSPSVIQEYKMHMALYESLRPYERPYFSEPYPMLFKDAEVSTSRPSADNAIYTIQRWGCYDGQDTYKLSQTAFWIPKTNLLEVAEQLGYALHALHRCGVQHGGIDGDNVLVCVPNVNTAQSTKLCVVLLGMGLARPIEAQRVGDPVSEALHNTAHLFNPDEYKDLLFVAKLAFMQRVNE
jgi:hypothetical protein